MKILTSLLGLSIALGAFVLYARKRSSTVRVERTLNAPLAKVWATWTEPESIKKWWGPKDFSAPLVKSDFKEGGTYLFGMRSPNGDIFWSTGSYRQIVAQQKIVATMSFADENGKVIPGPEVSVPGHWPDEITLSVEFKELGAKTQVTVTEVGIPLIMKLMAKWGWEQQFDKLDKLL